MRLRDTSLGLPLDRGATMLKGFHHVAFRCIDAAETIKFYTEVLGLRYSHAVSNDLVASTKEYSPHIHIFLELKDGSSIAFFEVPLSKPAQKDPNTPAWVQHVAFEVSTLEEFESDVQRLERYGIPYLGPTIHEDPTERSVYFFDPNGIRLELHLPGKAGTDANRALEVLQRWNARKASDVWGESRRNSSSY
jgi:catechol 2,3-dioxygenase-like lactoylglutathione lyase family enzyme